MKKFLVSVGLCVASLSGTMLKAGNSVGDGGQSLSLEFTRLGREVLLALSHTPSIEILNPEQLKEFEQQLNETRVDAVIGPILDNLGREVDARVTTDETYHERLIEINRTTWPRFISIRGRAHRLVFHEYLRILNIDDDNYVHSSKLESEPFLLFFNAQAPRLAGTKLYEQLESFYAAAAMPDWRTLEEGRWENSRCFRKDEDVGFLFFWNLRFTIRGNGPLLESSRMIEYSNGSNTEYKGV
ncbi:MAG: hypothetical protein NTV34_15875, partial [Proteobacteria bacterium]|nr:hypothetical protein [Pseudomonadota bacterium]